VPASALALTLAAAILHASWNLLLARARDPQAATAVAMVVGLVAYAPVAALVWRIDSPAWPYLALTSVLQLAYTTLLAAAYRRAELSVFYPVARGTAPVLVLAGTVALGAATSPGQALGVCVVALGIFLVRGRAGASSPVSLAFGLALAAFIAAYTVVDKQAIPHASPFAYLEVSMVLTGVAYASALGWRRGTGALRAELTPASVAAGLAVFGAYGLVLVALQRAPAAPVAAVRETSIVIATGLAGLVLGEKVGGIRILGAIVVAAGVALVSAS